MRPGQSVADVPRRQRAQHRGHARAPARRPSGRRPGRPGRSRRAAARPARRAPGPRATRRAPRARAAPVPRAAPAGPRRPPGRRGCRGAPGEPSRRGSGGPAATGRDLLGRARRRRPGRRPEQQQRQGVLAGQLAAGAGAARSRDRRGRRGCRTACAPLPRHRAPQQRPVAAGAGPRRGAVASRSPARAEAASGDRPSTRSRDHTVSVPRHARDASDQRGQDRPAGREVTDARGGHRVAHRAAPRPGAERRRAAGHRLPGAGARHARTWRGEPVVAHRWRGASTCSPASATTLTLHTHLKMEGSWHLYRPDSPLAAAGARGPGGAAHRGVDRGRASRSASSRWSPATPRTPSWATSARTCSAPTGTRTRRCGGCAPTRRARSPTRLLDQRNLAGIGNLYKNELCFLAGVHPRLPVGEVPDLPRLVRRARAALDANKERVEQTLTGDLRRGRQTWVYRRDKQPCRRCGQRIRVDSRGRRGSSGRRTGARAASRNRPADRRRRLRPRRRRRRRSADRSVPRAAQRGGVDGDLLELHRQRGLLEGDRVADLGEDLRERHVEGRADRGEQLGGGLLLAALDLRDVAEADPGVRGDLSQRAALPHPLSAQDLTEQPTEDHHGPAPFVEDHALTGGQRYRSAKTSGGRHRQLVSAVSERGAVP